MAEEATNIQEIKTSSDGMVKITIEKYNDLVETIAGQKGSINSLNEQLRRARNEPPVINRTVVQKTREMQAQEYKAWGATFMGGGASLFVIGALMFKAGYDRS